MLNKVNSIDLDSAIILACKTMSSVFNADDNDRPYFGALAWPNAYLGFSPYHCEGHIPGRHLNALLKARDLGFAVSQDAVEKHRRASLYSFSGPVPLPLNRNKIEGLDIQLPTGEPVNFLEANLREGMFALYVLSYYCQDKAAFELAGKMIGWINVHYLPNFAWDSANRDLGVNEWFSPYIAGVARMIGPLVLFWHHCGYEPALVLAKKLADRAVEHYPEDGGFDLDQMGTIHVHSITCVLSSLAQLADLTHDRELLSRVKRFYDNGLNQLRNELGWSNECVDRPLGRGELNNSGDILEIALILGRYYGATYDEDAERMIRGHILPAQLRDTSFIHDPENPDNMDCYRNLAERMEGAFGFAAPYGHYPKGETGEDGRKSFAFNLDIVGGTTASLCEAVRNCTSYSDGTHRIRLLFDRETEHVRVRSPYPDGVLSVIVKTPGSLMIRIPSWVDRAKLTVNTSDWTLQESWLVIEKPQVGQEIRIGIPLAERDTTIRYGDGRLKVRLRGDVVTAMENEGMAFAFFPEYLEE